MRRPFLLTLGVLVVLLIPVRLVFAEEQRREITTTGESWTWVAPDTYRVSIQSQHQASTSSEAWARVQEDLKLVQEKLSRTGVGANSLVDRGCNFQSRDPLKQSVTCYTGVEVASKDLVHKIYEIASSVQTLRIVDTRAFVREKNTKKLDAIERAVSDAKQKAQSVAKSMGVVLGAVSAIDVVEQPVGKIIRARRQSGEDIGNFADEDIHVLATVRHRIQ